MVAAYNDAFVFYSRYRCSDVPVRTFVLAWTYYLGRLQVYLEHSLLGAYLTVQANRIAVIQATIEKGASMDQLITIVLTAVVTCLVGRLLNGLLDNCRSKRKNK